MPIPVSAFGTLHGECFKRKQEKSMASTKLTFEGCNFLRQRLILATISGKTIKIKKIRYKDENPGLKGSKKIVC